MSRLETFAAGMLVGASLFACGQDESSRSGSAGPATNACSPLADAAVTVEYQAMTADGRYVVVTRGGGAGERIFYGTRDHMAEGRITSTASSCASHYGFDLEGTSYGAVFAGAVCNGNLTSKLSIGDVTAGGVTLPLTVLIGLDPPDAGASAASPADLKFFCL